MHCKSVQDLIGDVVVESAPAEARGAGLGLAITKALVELHGGRIWADSVLGQSSRFTVLLPQHQPR